MNFLHFPKVELHLHLDCSLSFDVVTKINPAITFDDYCDKFIAPSKCTDLADFLKRAPQGVRLMQSEHELQLVVRDLFEQLQRDNIIYAEIRFAPLQHLENGLKPEDVVDIVNEATEMAIKETGIEARIILCTLRHFSEAQSLETVQLLKRFRGTNVAGFDIAADEAGFPIDEHISAFRYAYEHKIPCTAHAGEARGPESVWETLENFQPLRIGHGVRSIEDGELIEYLKEKGIHLEVCPSCNVQIDIYDLYRNHPINRLYELGLSVGINTDGRTITNINLSEEYQKLHRAFGWTGEHFLRCNLNAIRSSFIPEKLKLNLIDQLKTGYEKL
jgi:adenosine deaminase